MNTSGVQKYSILIHNSLVIAIEDAKRSELMKSPKHSH